MEKGKNVYQKESLLQLGRFLNYGLKFNSWPGYKCGISENEFNYFAYNIDNLLTLHENLQNNYKLYNFMNKSKSSNFIHYSIEII